jgi:hypothetical protein
LSWQKIIVTLKEIKKELEITEYPDESIREEFAFKILWN